MIKQKITRFVMETEEYGKFPCDLPASLLSVLMENGVVRDPYYGENILEYKNKLAHSVTFSASFKVSGDIYVKKQIYIRLHGIDTRCAVSLNGQQIGECNSIYSVYTLRAKDYIRLGENEITLTFRTLRKERLLFQTPEYSQT